MLGVEMMHKMKRTDQMGDGIIINIASLVGLDPWFLMPIYAASKHAIVAFSRAFSVSLFDCWVPFPLIFDYIWQHEYYFNQTGVKIAVLCPGATKTTFVRQFAGNMIYPDEIMATELFKHIPNQRWIHSKMLSI